MVQRRSPTLILCLAGAGLVVTSAALGLGAGSNRPGAAPPPAPPVTAPGPSVSTTGDGYGSTAPGTGATTAPAPTALSIQDFTFVAPGTVAPGATVAVTNLDSVDHTVTARDGGFDTGSLAAGQAATVTAPTGAGRYEFFCGIHPDMVGTLTVG